MIGVVFPPVPEGTLLHKVLDWLPLLTFFSGIVAVLLRQQTRHIKGIVREMTEEHNKNGGAHILVASALRQERGELFREIAEQINDQNVTLARMEERGDATAEQLEALVEAHNATISDANMGGRRVIPTKVRVKDPSYTGPFRRKSDPK